MPDPWWQEAVDAVARLQPDRLSPPWQDGLEVTIPFIDNTIYVPYLQRRFAALGGDIRQATIAHLDDLAKRYSLVVNCTGVGAHDLVDDPEVYPIRGQVIRVQRPPDMGPTIVDVHTETDDLTYIVPRRHDCLLGGTSQAHNWETTPDVDIARRILERCTELYPDLREVEVL